MSVTMFDLISKRNGQLALKKVKEIPYDEELQSYSSVLRAFRLLVHPAEFAEEHLWVLAVNTKLEPVAIFEIAHGGVTEAGFDTHGIFSRLLLCNCVAFFLCHNHPSGASQPSEEDVSMTKTVKSVANTLGYSLLDHVIIGRYSNYSFRERSDIFRSEANE